jgi:hypothetical protein
MRLTLLRSCHSLCRLNFLQVVRPVTRQGPWQTHPLSAHWISRSMQSPCPILGKQMQRHVSHWPRTLTCKMVQLHIWLLLRTPMVITTVSLAVLVRAPIRRAIRIWPTARVPAWRAGLALRHLRPVSTPDVLPRPRAATEAADPYPCRSGARPRAGDRRPWTARAAAAGLRSIAQWWAALQ